MKATPLPVCAGILLVAALVHTPVASASTLFDSYDVDKFDETFHLGLMGMSFTLMQPGTLAYDAESGLASYHAYSGSHDAGFEITLTLEVIDHAPRCYLGDCSGSWYQQNGVDPANDWTFFGTQAGGTNTIAGFGDYAGIVLQVLGDKFFQLGLGAGGYNVTPEGLAFSGWFGLADAESGAAVGNGDVNANLAPIPVPAPVMLLGSALLGLAGMRRTSPGAR